MNKVIGTVTKNDADECFVTFDGDNQQFITFIDNMICNEKARWVIDGNKVIFDLIADNIILGYN